MKKNVMMRLASVMLVLVLLTSSVISGTFAKYVTAENGGDSARVAKWGVGVEVDGEMFAEAYEYDDVVAAAVGGNTSVEAYNGTDKLVAPGTAGEMVDIKLKGVPEVDVKVTYEATVTFDRWAVTDDNFYCPLVLTINGTDYYMNDFADAAAAKTFVENVINGYSAEYNANTNLETDPTVLGDVLTISWSWPYETGADAAAIAANDKRDTELGDLAAAGQASTIAVDVICTVTQVD